MTYRQVLDSIPCNIYILDLYCIRWQYVLQKMLARAQKGKYRREPI